VVHPAGLGALGEAPLRRALVLLPRPPAPAAPPAPLADALQAGACLAGL